MTWTALMANNGKQSPASTLEANIFGETLSRVLVTSFPSPTIEDKYKQK